MDRIIFGDNQFFGINHVSDEKARAQAIRFKDDRAILETIDTAVEVGVHTLMCTTHDRMASICSLIRHNPVKYFNFSIYPCMPYAHKYANAVTEFGIVGTLQQYVPGSFFGSLIKGGAALVSKDYISMMELMIDAEMKIFKGISTPVIFLQNVITDLLLGLGMKDLLKAFHDYIIKKYHAEPGYITMNMPKLLSALEEVNVVNPIICSSINKAGFRMSGGIALYEQTLRSGRLRAIAMQVLAGGSIHSKEAIDYVCTLPNIESILFGASSRQNIHQTVSLITEGDRKQNKLTHYSIS